MMKLKGSVGAGGRNEEDDVRLVQSLLNRSLTSVEPLLKVDGKVGPRTLQAIERFQRTKLGRCSPDRRVDPDGATFAMLASAKSSPFPFDLFYSLRALLPPDPYAFARKWPDLNLAPPPAPGRPPSIANASAKPARPVAAGERKIAWGAKVSAGFKAKVLTISEDLGINPDFLMACMAFESGGTFSPSVKNAAGSGATGLIQFMPSTAKGLGTTTDDLGKMTAEGQLDYVHRYFKPYKNKLNSIEDIYMTILWPAAIGKGKDHVLFEKADKKRPKLYSQNAGLDTNKDDKVTVEEAAAKIRKRYDEGLKEGNIG